MNICVLIAGMWFLKLDTGYEGVAYVNTGSITAFRDNTGGGIVRGDSTFQTSAWDEKGKRWLTADELVAIMETCGK